MRTLIDCLKFLFKEDDTNPLSPEELRVYITLLKEWNRLGRPEWFEYRLRPNVTSKVGTNVIPKSTLMRIRERLTKRGLIQYVSGNGKVNNPLFKICGETNCETKDKTNSDTNSKEKVSPTPPLKENITESKEKEKTTKVVSKKETDLSFCLPSFVPIMEEWLAFKKEKGQTYKPIGLRACYHNLIKLSDSNPAIAKLIVEQSIANNYSGLFELRNHGAITNQNSRGNNINPGSSQTLFSDYLRENFGFDGSPEEFEEWFNRNPYGG